MLEHAKYTRIDSEGVAFISIDSCGDERHFMRWKLGEAKPLPYTPSAAEQRIADEVLQEAANPNGILRLFFEATDFDIDWRR